MLRKNVDLHGTSVLNPDAYVESNMVGFYNILEACRHSYDNTDKGVEHLAYASSFSVYGSNKKIVKEKVYTRDLYTRD